MITITDSREQGLGFQIRNTGKFAFVFHDTVKGFFINTYGRVVVQSEFKEYLDEIKYLTKEVKRLNRIYGY